MQEKLINLKTQIKYKTIEEELKRPLSQPFEILIYLKRRMDEGLITTLDDVKKDLDVGNKIAKDYLGLMKKVQAIKIMLEGGKKGIIITDKGEQLIFKGILPIFPKQEEIVRKIFFHQKLTRNDLLERDTLTVLEKYSKHTSETHRDFLRSWLSIKFREYILFEEWIEAFNKDYSHFFRRDLEKFIEKNLKQSKGSLK